MANIFWSYQEHKLVSSIYSTNTIGSYTWVLRDVIPVSLYVVTKQNVTSQPYVAGEIPAGYTFKIAAKEKGKFRGNPLLCGNDWVKTGSGETTVYTCNIRLNNPSLVGVMEGDSTSSWEIENLELVGEITRITNEGENCDSTQFQISIIPDVIRDNDQCPTVVEYSSSSSNSSSQGSSLSSGSSQSSLSSLSSG